MGEFADAIIQKVLGTRTKQELCPKGQHTFTAILEPVNMTTWIHCATCTLQSFKFTLLHPVQRNMLLHPDDNKTANLFTLIEVPEEGRGAIWLYIALLDEFGRELNEERQLVVFNENFQNENKVQFGPLASDAYLSRFAIFLNKSGGRPMLNGVFTHSSQMSIGDTACLVPGDLTVKIS